MSSAGYETGGIVKPLKPSDMKVDCSLLKMLSSEDRPQTFRLMVELQGQPSIDDVKRYDARHAFGSLWRMNVPADEVRAVAKREDVLRILS